MTVPVSEWLARFSEELGVDAPSEEEVSHLLLLASVAADVSERTAAPVSCWIAAVAGVPPTEALAAAERLAVELGVAPSEGT